MGVVSVCLSVCLSVSSVFAECMHEHISASLEQPTETHPNLSLLPRTARSSMSWTEDLVECSTRSFLGPEEKVDSREE